MVDLVGHVRDYLELRRALGFKLVFEGHVLPRLANFIEASGAGTLTTELAISWACQPEDVQPITLAHRLGAARGFARYLKTIDPATEIPPLDVFGTRRQRPTPYLWSKDGIAALLEATLQIRPELRALTHETLFGLIAVTGLRLGEATRLLREDVNLTDGILTITEAKFDRTRLIPLHPSTTAALASYAQRRDRLCPAPQTAAFFLSHAGTMLRVKGVDATFKNITTGIGLRTATVKPRIHDLRHTFAVQTLIDWHRTGADIGAGVPVLSTYLGHVSPAGTYWYLSAAPELMALAAERLDRRFGAQS